MSLARPKVAYLMTDSGTGGAQTHLAQLHAALAARVDATVLAGGRGDNPGGMFATMAANGATTIPLTQMDNALSPLRAVRLLATVLRLLRDVRPDLLHVHSAKAGAVGRVAGALLRIPVVYTVHGFAFKAEAPPLQRRVARLMEWLLAPLTTRMICVAEEERALANSLPIAPRRVHMIHNGIPDTPLRAGPQAPMRQIVMVARFAPPKRPDLLIEAAAEARLPDGCRIVIAGNGPQWQAAQQQAARAMPGRIDLPGDVNPIAPLLAESQIFVLLSDHEGLPISVLEAMRAGLPIVASDLPGIREQLDGGQCGILVDHRDRNAVRQTLEKLCDDAALRARLGAAARRRYEQGFGVTPMAERTWAIYQDVLAGPSGREQGQGEHA
jgi:glycosyltransferase involved in cell wall biosynthesis